MNNFILVDKENENGEEEKKIAEPKIIMQNPNLAIADYGRIMFKFYRQTDVVICMDKETLEQTVMDHESYESWGTIYNPAFKEHKFLSGWIHKMVNYVDPDPVISLTKKLLIKFMVQSMDSCYRYNSMDMYECIIDQCDTLDAFAKMHPSIPLDVHRVFEQAMRANSEVYRFYVATNSHMMDIFIKNNE